MLLPLFLICQTLSSGVQLPESEAARAWAAVGPQTVPASIDEGLLVAAPWLVEISKASAQERWQTWADWLHLEAGADETSLPCRAGLLVLAADQDRWEDAWAHFSRLGGSPEWTAAMMPYLLPGISMAERPALGGLAAPLPDGVLLHPALPPALPGDPRGSLRHRIAKIDGIRLADATINMQITVEPSGVQVDLLHVSGGAVTLSVLLPETFGREITIEYIDWMREDVPHQALTVQLLPGSEELNLFGRYSRVGERLPQVPKGDLARGIRNGGLWFDCGEDPQLKQESLSFAKALGRVFDLPVGLTSAANPPLVEPWTPTVCHLPAGAAGRRKLLALASAAERYALEQR